MTHELKILPKWYADVESGKKNFEIRVNDRDYKVGDTLVLQEYDKGNYTGREITRKIQYIYQGNGAYGLSEEYCILGLEQEPCEDAISRKAMLEYQQYLHGKMSNEENHKLWKFIKALPPVTPQPKTGYISIDDVMSVFDDFMCGKVDENETETFLEMLKDKLSESEDV